MYQLSINAYTIIFSFQILHIIIAYNVTISSSLTPADLSGFDIMISWTVSDDSVMGIHTV